MKDLLYFAIYIKNEIEGYFVMDLVVTWSPFKIKNELYYFGKVKKVEKGKHKGREYDI